MGKTEKKVQIEGKVLKVSDLLASDRKEWHSLRNFATLFNAEDPYLTVSTSGSTGAPKPVRMVKKYMEASARKTLDFFDIAAGSKVLFALPPDKIGGLMMLVRWWVGNLDIYPVEPQSRPLQAVQGSFDLASMVPYQVHRSLDELHRISTVLIGGAGITPGLEKKLNRHPGLWHTYGMTETLSHVALRKIDPEGDPLFQALPGVSFTLDERQCLIIKAPDIGVDGLVTNDVAELRDSRSFLWLGRYDHVVNSGGFKFYPEILEQKVGEWDHPFFFTGVPDEKLGEKLVLVVEKKGPVEGKILDQLNHRLTKYEKPRSVITIARFEYTVTGKLDRKRTLSKI